MTPWLLSEMAVARNPDARRDKRSEEDWAELAKMRLAEQYAKDAAEQGQAKPNGAEPKPLPPGMDSL